MRIISWVSTPGADSALHPAFVRHGGDLRLTGVQLLPARIDGAGAVAQDHIAQPQGQQQLGNGNACSAAAVDDRFALAQGFAGDLGGVDQCGRDHNGGAVLIVVEDRNIAALFQLLLDLKAAGRSNILQVDTAKGAADVVHRLHKFVHILGAHAQGEGVYAAEFLKQHALALHHGHTGLRANVAQTQYRRAIGDHRYHIPAAGQLPAFVVICLNSQARLGHAGGVGQGQSILVVHLGPCHHFYFAFPLTVES